jgi:hypothetical protein
MATTKPRITITLNQRCYNILKSISDCSGKPMSGFVAEMMESASPTLERMAATFQKIKTAQDAERSRFLVTIDEAQAAIEPVVMETLGQFDLFLGKIDAAADAVTAREERASGTAAAAAESPPTNRGDTPIRAHASKPSKRKALEAVSQKQVLKKISASKTHKPRGKAHAV